jgi:hypothetical protein
MTITSHIAIKYNKVFVDGYWNSRAESFAAHQVRIMTSWAMVVDVWFMDPVERAAGETGADFARRVQRMVRKHAGAASALEGQQRLQHQRVAVASPCGHRRFDHRVFAAYLIGEDRHLKRLFHAQRDIEIGQTWLDHHAIGALGKI